MSTTEQAPAEQPSPAPPAEPNATGSTHADPAPATDSAAPTTTSNGAAPPLDPFAALSNMWSGWMQPSNTPNTNSGASNGVDATQSNSNNSATPATDLLQGAGRMWNDVSASLKDAAGNVDAKAIGEGVTVFKQRSGQLMEDVSRSVQNLNISLQTTDLTKGASAITSSTRELLGKASQSLEQGRKEALQIFVDADPSAPDASSRQPAQAGQYAPWDVDGLPDGEKPYSDALRQEVLKLVVDSIFSKKKRERLFLSDVANKHGFSFDFDKNAGTAMAALEADTNMRRLRAGLVPGKMSEQAFWQTYFYHVHRVRQTLVANGGVMPEGSGQEDDEEDVDSALLFGDDDDDAAAAVGDSTANAGDGADDSPDIGGDSGEPDGGERNWEEDIEAAFKDE